jgi:hypothetical protein
MAIQAAAAIGRSRVSRSASAVRRSINRAAGGGAGPSINCPELNCVQALLSRGAIEDAAHRAAALGVSADRVLIAAGTLSEEVYLRALAATLGAAFESLEETPRALCPLNDERLIESAAAGILPLSINDEPTLVVAPRDTAARRILQLIDENPARVRLFRLTSAERLNRFVLRHAGTALAARAANSLKRKWPILSAAPPRWHTNILSIATIMLLALGAFIMTPAATMLAFEVMLAVVFLAWLALRLVGACIKSSTRDPLPDPPDDALPVYTVIAALYREAASVDGLLRAIEQLDYLGIMAQAPQDRG